MAIYWFYDNICFFINVKLSNYDPVKALTRDGAAWCVRACVRALSKLRAFDIWLTSGANSW